MPIKIDCPRCKKPLSVPGKMAGSYATCPMCNGRFWVPPGASRESPHPANAASPPGVASSAGPAVLASPPAGRPPAASPPPSGGAWAVPPPPAAPARKVARFITVEAAQSTLRLADDGKLPDLHLEEGEGAGQKRATQRSLNPLVMFGLLAISAVFSLMMLFIGPSSERPSNASQKAAARYKIQQDYFADEEHLKLENPPPLKPYQLLLRDAQRAYSRGDYGTEQQQYRRVLQLLRAEHGKFEGITGSPARDRVLEEQLTILLSK